MTNEKDQALTDGELLQVYLENSARIRPTFKALRAKGEKFQDSVMLERLKKVYEDHVDRVEKADAGSVDPTSFIDMQDGNYFLTCAQNNTKVHKDFFDTVKRFCSAKDARLMVSKITYKTKGFENLTADSDDLWYDPCLIPYLMNEQVRLGDFLFYGNVDILPTAVNPLSGFENHSGEENCAFPHPKLHMRPIATMPRFEAKHMYTTGTVTLRNYVKRKAGQKAELHHVFGGLFVQVKRGKAKVTPVSAEELTGSFHVYDEVFTVHGSSKQNVFAVNFGDIHLEKVTPEYEKQMKRVLDDLNPQHVFLHDLLDFEARNHHEVKDKFSRYKKYLQKKDSVHVNVMQVYSWLQKLAVEYPKTHFHIVPSNHNDAFYKWANSVQPENDYPNIRFWHLVNYLALSHIKDGENQEEELLVTIARHFDIQFRPNITFHERGESVRYFNIEYNLHGDMGANGSRGTPQGLAKLGFKANSGHTHSAGIYNGVYVAGVCCTLDHGYNKGLGSWSNSFILTYNSGKRSIITHYPK